MKPKLRIILFCSVVFMTAFLCCPSSTPEVQNLTVTDYFPIETPIVYPTTTLTSIEGKLPGISPNEIQKNMEENGFECELAYEPAPSDPYYKWECRKETSLELMLVDYWSTSLYTVDQVRAIINQFGIPDDSIAYNLLGFMAALPYDGSNPQQAKEWVALTLPTIYVAGDVREMEIGNVNFQLYGIPSVRSLKI
jgi:hypothetical protein